MVRENPRHSVDDCSEKQVVTRTRSLNLWRPSSLVNLVSNTRRRNRDSIYSSSSIDGVSGNSDTSPITPEEQPRNGWFSVKESHKRGWNTIVTVVVVEARGLPEPPSDGGVHNLYCKIRLGSETLKTKSVVSSPQPEWRERLKLHLKKDHLLRVSLWDKGKQKNFMGSCVIDLSSLDKERTHEIWQSLDDGFGAVHLNVTMCAIRNVEDSPDPGPNLEDIRNKFNPYDLSDWTTVGQLHVRVVGARGLNGKPNAYCTLEVGNARVQTHAAKATSEPMWKKNYVFNVHDVMSTLDLKVYDSSIVSSLRMEYLGKVSIPLFRIHNGEARWYALKDRSKRNIAKGNSPRVLLEMSLIWNPVKASLRLFRPTEVKYISKKPPKFDIALVYSNLIFVRDVFNFLYELNEGLKSAFEWDNRELSTVALLAWLVFWYHIRLWTAPLLLLLPFFYYWFNRRNEYEVSFMRTYSNVVVDIVQSDGEKIETSLTSKIQGLPEVTLTITNGIEYLASIAERIYNLVSFKVPFLSYLTMILLVIVSMTLYFISFNYIMMGLGIYKYTRKYLNSGRKLNNDILDFISRIPDNEILKDWKELSVPEPHHRISTGALIRSHST